MNPLEEGILSLARIIGKRETKIKRASWCLFIPWRIEFVGNLQILTIRLVKRSKGVKIERKKNQRQEDSLMAMKQFTLWWKMRISNNCHPCLPHCIDIEGLICNLFLPNVTGIFMKKFVLNMVWTN